MRCTRQRTHTGKAAAQGSIPCREARVLLHFRRSGWTRPLGVSLLLSLLLPEVAFAFSQETYPASRARLEASLHLPKKAAVLRQCHDHGAPRTLVLIQDLHCHAEAQGHIAEMLNELRPKGHSLLVGVEGDSSRIAVEQLASFPGPAVRRWVTRQFLHSGRISGPEAAAIETPDALLLQGVEAPDLYQRAHRQMRRLLKSGAELAVAEWQEALDVLKSNRYSPGLERLEHLRQQYAAGHLSLPAFEAGIAAESGQPRPLPRPNQSENEREAAAEACLLGMLWARCLTDSQRQLVVAQAWATLLARLTTIAATPEEVSRCQQLEMRRPLAASLAWTLQARGGLEADGGSEDDTLYAQLLEGRIQALAFYALADQRSEVMVRRMLENWSDASAKTAVLVAGGFHTPKIAAACRRHAINLVIIAPVIRHRDLNNPYYSLLAGRPSRLQQWLTSGRTAHKMPSFLAQPAIQSEIDWSVKVTTAYFHLRRGLRPAAVEAQTERDLARWPSHDPSLTIDWKKSRLNPAARGGWLRLVRQVQARQESLWVRLHPRGSQPTSLPRLEQRDLNGDAICEVIDPQASPQAERFMAMEGIQILAHAWKDRLARGWADGWTRFAKKPLFKYGAVLVLSTLGVLFAQSAYAAAGVVYTVAPGDYLCRIAAKLGVTVHHLLAQNPAIVNPDLIFPGQTFQAVLEDPSQIAQGKMRHARGQITVQEQPPASETTVDPTPGDAGFTAPARPPDLSPAPESLPQAVHEVAPGDAISSQPAEAWLDGLLQPFLDFWATLPMEMLWITGLVVLAGILILAHRSWTARPARASRPAFLGGRVWKDIRVVVNLLAGRWFWLGPSVSVLVVFGGDLSSLFAILWSLTLHASLQAWVQPSSFPHKRRQGISLRTSWYVLLASLQLANFFWGTPSLLLLAGLGTLAAAAKLGWTARTLWRHYGPITVAHMDEPAAYWDVVSRHMVLPHAVEALQGNGAPGAPFLIVAHEAYGHPLAATAADFLLSLPLFRLFFSKNSIAEYALAAEEACARRQRPPPGYYFWNVIACQTLASLLDPLFYPAALVKNKRMTDSYGWIYATLYHSFLYALVAPLLPTGWMVAATVLMLVVWGFNSSYIRREHPRSKLDVSITDALWSGPTKLAFLPISATTKFLYELGKGSWKWYLNAKSKGAFRLDSKGLKEAYGTGMTKFFLPLILKMALAALFMEQVAWVFGVSWAVGSGAYVLFDSGPRLYYYFSLLAARIRYRLKIIPGIGRWSSEEHSIARITNDNAARLLAPIITQLRARYPGSYSESYHFRVLPEDKLRLGQELSLVGEVSKDGSIQVNPFLLRLNADAQMSALKYLLDIAGGRSYYRATLDEYFSLARVFHRAWRLLLAPSRSAAGVVLFGAGVGLLAAGVAAMAGLWLPLWMLAILVALFIHGWIHHRHVGVRDVIVLDGPATVRKHELAILLARRYGYNYLNLELLRRALGYAAMAKLAEGVQDPEGLTAYLQACVIRTHFVSRTGRTYIRLQRPGPGPVEELEAEDLLRPEVKQAARRMQADPSLNPILETQLRRSVADQARRQRDLVVVGHRRTPSFTLFESNPRLPSCFWVTDESPRPAARPHPDAVLLDMRYLTTAEALKVMTERSRPAVPEASKTQRFRNILCSGKDAWVGLAATEGLDEWRLMFGSRLESLLRKDMSRALHDALDQPEILRLNGKRGIREMEQFCPQGRSAFMLDPSCTPSQVEQALASIRNFVHQRLQKRYALLSPEAEPDAGQLEAWIQAGQKICQRHRDPSLVRIWHEPLYGVRILIRLDRGDLDLAIARDFKALNLAPGTSGVPLAAWLERLLNTRLQPVGPARLLGQAAPDRLEPLPIPPLIFGVTRASWADPAASLEEALSPDRRAADAVDAAVDRARYYLQRARQNLRKKVVVDSGRASRVRARPAVRITSNTIDLKTRARLRAWRRQYSQHVPLRDADGHFLYDAESPWILSEHGLESVFTARLPFWRNTPNFDPVVVASRAPLRHPSDVVQTRLLLVTPARTALVDVACTSCAPDDQTQQSLLQTVISPEQLAQACQHMPVEQAIPSCLAQWEQALSRHMRQPATLAAVYSTTATPEMSSLEKLHQLADCNTAATLARPEGQKVQAYHPELLPLARSRIHALGQAAAQRWLALSARNSQQPASAKTRDRRPPAGDNDPVQKRKTPTVRLRMAFLGLAGILAGMLHKLWAAGPRWYSLAGILLPILGGCTPVRSDSSGEHALPGLALVLAAAVVMNTAFRLAGPLHRIKTVSSPRKPRRLRRGFAQAA